LYLPWHSAPPSANEKAAPSFGGFLICSAGFALLFAALDQGQRLDWWRSGLFNALIFRSNHLPARHPRTALRMPNPLVDLPYLRLWNTQLLGFLLMLFRFSLLPRSS